MMIQRILLLIYILKWIPSASADDIIASQNSSELTENAEDTEADSDII